MNLALARRYARALADILFAARLPAEKQRAELKAAKQHLTDFAALLHQHAALRTVLTSPAVPREKKLALLDALRGPLGFSAITRNFVAVLLDNRRLDQLDGMLAAFDREVYARLGIAPVEVTTAVALTAEQKKALEARLQELTGGSVELRYREDSGVLAGLVARLGSTIYDASLRGQLRRLQLQLTMQSR